MAASKSVVDDAGLATTRSVREMVDAREGVGDRGDTDEGIERENTYWFTQLSSRGYLITW